MPRCKEFSNIWYTYQDEEKEKYYVYFITDGAGCIKIGMTGCIEARLSELQTSNPHKLCLVCYHEVYGDKEAHKLETNLHKQFERDRLCGEWFKFSPDIFCYIRTYIGDTLKSVVDYMADKNIQALKSAMYKNELERRNKNDEFINFLEKYADYMKCGIEVDI